MFKNLNTGTKLFILCGLFITSLGVATYQIVIEKQIAIDFTRRELVGNRYLGALRDIYVAVLASPPSNRSTGLPQKSRAQALGALASAEATAGKTMHTAELESALAAALTTLWSSQAEPASDDPSRDVLAKTRGLAARIGDDSNLTLDPDLDTFYLQNIVVIKIPVLIGQISELQSLLDRADATDPPPAERRARALLVQGALRSTMDDIQADLASAYRGSADGSVRQAADTAFAAMLSASATYLDLFKAGASTGEANAIDVAAIERPNAGAVRLAVDALAVTQGELDRLLKQRIDGQIGRLDGSLALLAALSCLCVLFAVMTYQHIARPLERFESIVKKVHETGNYNLRIDHASDDEIGKLAAAFNKMLSELAAVRAQESSDHLELGHVARLTTMGGMTASIAHEINQPLAAIAANANAGLRWLSRATPEVDETRAVLKQIVSDAHRTSRVIESIRSIFKKDSHKRAPVGVNDVIRDVLALAHGRLKSPRVSVKLELADDLPQILADRVQLQQVILNLIMNGIDAMAPIKDRARRLVIKSGLQQAGSDVVVTVQDAGTGIGEEDMGRIFDAFFTTKTNGMGMGLFICRSIIEAHGGRLWASAGTPHGSVFHVALPTAAGPGGASMQAPMAPQ